MVNDNDDDDVMILVMMMRRRLRTTIASVQEQQQHAVDVRVRTTMGSNEDDGLRGVTGIGTSSI